jgi:NitT/TauT family transport system ATP-binding protein
MTGIRIQCLGKHYGPKEVIRDLNLDIRSGEFVAIVGPSGCGKSTLLQLLSGLDQPTQGGFSFGKADPRIGVVFQNPRLLPWRTVRENLELVLNDAIDPQTVDHWMHRIGLPGIMEQYPERLSLGMMRRVALARAFAVEPDLLLMDEPLVSLDAPTARKIRALLLSLWTSRPHTVVYVTHDLREAIELADRLVFVAASPMRVVADLKVPLARGERSPEAIESLVSELQSGHPDLRSLI